MLQIDSSLQSLVTQLSATLQNKCVLLSPNEFQNREWISAVVCGKNPAQNSEYRLLQMSGLLHLVVVSGSHLVFIEQILSFVFERFKWRLLAKILVLTAFALITGFQPPVVRALCSQLLNHFQNSTKLFWSPPAVTLFAGLITLMIAPAWWKSLSLQLSWVAALSLQISPGTQNWSQKIKQQLHIFVLMFPLLMQFAPPHPASILYNLAAAPFLGVVMFPASAAAMLFPSALSFVDSMWSWFFKVLDVSVPRSGSLEPIELGSLAFIWAYVFALNIFFVMREQKR